MRVAFIVGHFPRLSETFILNQITGLIDRGHEVDIYAEYEGETAKLHPDVEKYQLLQRTYYLTPIPTHGLVRVLKGVLLLFQGYTPRRWLRSLNVFQYGLLAASLRLFYSIAPSMTQPYDIVHCQFGTQGFRGLWFRAVNAPQAKLITMFRGHDISQFVKERGETVYHELFQQGDFFLANCEFFRQKAIQLGCDPDRILVHFSGLDVHKFTFKPRYLQPAEPIRLATTGRLVEKKGIEYVIRAIAQRIEQYPNLEYTIIGDGPLRHSLEHLIQALNLSTVVKLVGWKNEQEIIEILDQTHLFIAPSITADTGDQDAPINVLKEAMAMGLPVVSTYHGGIPELVEDGVSGLLVPERDVNALAETLGYLVEHPDRWAAMGQAGRRYVETHFDLQSLNDRLVSIYQQVLQSTSNQ
ncbi:glycosyltransferase [Thermocoleostomius sinensis]|uniref:Glycosyltransferase n=1 Tax=Thermocoleostomius sinensis A174 TaxID=2016057 RepID=A0A9E9C882_9CYAN|nr:glycosyltransferase [Thermocoleostomius sinensis]WAL61144.1 glycosyltransferase [Thermocoleostomius sinensis A174]